MWVSLSTDVDTISGNYGYEEFENPQSVAAYNFSLDSTSNVEISFEMLVLDCNYYCSADALVLLFENDILVNSWQNYQDLFGYTEEGIPSELELASGDYTLVYGNYNNNYYPSIGMSLNDAISQVFTNSNNSNENFSFQMELIAYDGTCDYPGCMDSTAFNFNPIATIDDGSCDYPTYLGSLQCGVDTMIYGATTSNYGFENSVYYAFDLDNDSEMIINLDGYSSMYDPYILLFDSTQSYLQTISYSQTYYINDYSVYLDAGEYYMIVTEDNPYFYGGALQDYYSAMENNDQNTGEFTLSLIIYDGTCDYPGCMDSTALNFNPDATIDNSSCDYITDLGSLQCGVSLSTNIDTISGNYGYEEFENPQSVAYIASLDSTSNIEISFEMLVWDCNYSCMLMH